MSVYFLAAKVTKTRYTLAGALLATLAGALLATLAGALLATLAGTVASVVLAARMV